MELRSTEMHIRPSDKPDVVVSGDLTELAWTTPGYEDGNADIVYSSTGDATISIGGLPASTEIVARSGSGNILNYTTTDANGNATMTVPSGSSQEVYLQSAPQTLIVDGATPTGPQPDEPDSLSVNVSHDGSLDIDTTVEFYYEGSLIDTQSVTTNATVTTSLSSQTLTAGDNNWSVVVTDELGHSQTNNYTFQTPDELKIFDEDNPSQLVDQVTVEIIFFEAGNRGQTFEKTTSDGTVNMTGLPVNMKFVAKASASGYYDRRTFISSLYSQEAIYLVQDTKDVVEVEFELTDFSGAFPKEHTVLEIQRNLKNDWRTVEGDYFGAVGGFGATLRQGFRHELRVINTETGQTRDIGRFTPNQAGTHTIQINPDLSADFSQPDVSMSWDPASEVVFGSKNLKINAEISSQGEELQNYQVTAVWTDTGNTLFSDSGASNSGEEWNMNLDVLDLGAGELEIKVVYNLNNGESGEFSKTYNVRKNYENEFSLTSWLVTLPENFASFGAMGSLLAIMLTTMIVGFVGSRTPASTELLGVIALMSISFFALIQWVTWSLVFAGAITWVGFAGLRRM
jgi:hypothetical protein